MKSKIIKEIEFLLNSSKERNTDQGRLVCEKTIEILANCNSDTVLIKALKAYNKAYIGIESHGHLTNKEYESVKILREIESSYL